MQSAARPLLERPPLRRPRQQLEEEARRRIRQKVEEASRAGRAGTWSLFSRELRRFLNVARQTVLAPIVTTMLYFVVFGFSLGDRLQSVQGVPYIDFLVPGLVMLAVINNAFLNSAFSLFIGKINGTLVDLLVTPLSASQLLLAFVGASVVRAMVVGAAVWGVALAMGARAFGNVFVVLFFMTLTATSFALLGVIVAIIAEQFDHLNLLPSFLLTPLTFLGGVFYSIEMLPPTWALLSRLNPVLYMVNGLRHGMVGTSDVPPWQGALLLLTLAGTFAALAIWLLRSGKKLRE